MKAELLETMTKSLGSLEKEMSGLRSELAEMKGQGRASDGEQRLLEMKIGRTEEVLTQFKEQWKT